MKQGRTQVQDRGGLGPVALAIALGSMKMPEQYFYSSLVDDHMNDMTLNINTLS